MPSKSKDQSKSKTTAQANGKRSKGGGSSKGQAGMVKEDLQRQENRALRRATQPSPGDQYETQLQDAAKASMEFARSISGGDKAKLVQAFQAAYNIAVSAQDESEERSAVAKVLRGVPPVASQLFNSNPVYVENAARLIQDLNRVVGGVPTTEFADCVAVGSSAQWCCTGTLVAKNVVVTAGHCEGGCSARIFIGTNVTGSGEEVKVINAVRHPSYNQGGKHNDLTVLILERDVTSVKPRKLATAAMINQATYVRVVGFGNTDPDSTTGYGIRRMVDVPIASVSCSAATDQSKYGCDKGLELVAGKPLLNKDSCNGDSGGPIYVKSGNQWYLAGATSRATNNSTRPCGDGGIYVRIDKYATWIRSVPGGHW
jgi:hypothetical protein